MHDAHKAQAATYNALSQALLESTVEDQHKMLDYRAIELEAKLIGEHLEASAKPVDLSKYKEPVMYYEASDGSGRLPGVICTCGQQKRHLRMKVLNVWSEKHFMKTGHKPAE